MKQPSIADGVIKDLFGVSGRDFQEIKSEIAALQKGELIIKDTTLAALGISGKTYKREFGIRNLVKSSLKVKEAV